MTREEAIRRIKAWNLDSDDRDVLAVVIPEFHESEDERIRKQLIDAIKIGRSNSGISFTEEAASRYIAWLEKQGNSADKIESKFKVGDKVHLEGDDVNILTITGIEKDRYLTDISYGPILFGAEDIWERVEQKPAESISQLPVQGKGVYKICPRCKERMVRDDSMVYTSMPPQYRYECPKCGESECDTVMYDNPETEEQKPSINIDQLKSLMLQYLQEAANEKDDLDIEADTDKWARKILGYDFEQKPVDYEAELKKCKDNPLYFYDKYVSIKRKPAKWSEEEEQMFSNILNHYSLIEAPTDGNGITKERYLAFIKSLRSQSRWKPSEVCYGPKGDPDSAGVWKPSEEQMKALLNAEGFLRAGLQHDSAKTIADLYEQLKKL